MTPEVQHESLFKKLDKENDENQDWGGFPDAEDTPKSQIESHNINESH